MCGRSSAACAGSTACEMGDLVGAGHSEPRFCLLDCGGHLTCEEVGSEGDEAGCGEPVAGGGERGRETPPGVQDEHSRPVATVGESEVAGTGLVPIHHLHGTLPAMSAGSDERRTRSKDDSCDLCEAARITPWFHEDDVCWIAECEICATPMVVWRWHGTRRRPTDLAHMHAELARVAGGEFSRPLRRRQHAQHPRPLPRPCSPRGGLLRPRLPHRPLGPLVTRWIVRGRQQADQSRWAHRGRLRARPAWSPSRRSAMAARSSALRS